MFLVADHGHTLGMTKMVPALVQQSLQDNTQTHRSSRPQPHWSQLLQGRCSCAASLHCRGEKQGPRIFGEAHIWSQCQTSCASAAVQVQDLAVGPGQIWLQKKIWWTNLTAKNISKAGKNRLSGKCKAISAFLKRVLHSQDPGVP